MEGQTVAPYFPPKTHTETRDTNPGQLQLTQSRNCSVSLIPAARRDSNFYRLSKNKLLRLSSSYPPSYTENLREPLRDPCSKSNEVAYDSLDEKQGNRVRGPIRKRPYEILRDPCTGAPGRIYGRVYETPYGNLYELFYEAIYETLYENLKLGIQP